MFYDTFHKLCLDKGVSDSRACTDMGLSRSYAAKMKNKDGTPSMDSLSAMSEYFGVSVDYLLHGDELRGDDPEKPSKKEKPTAQGGELISDLPENIQELISICLQNPDFTVLLLTLAQRMQNQPADQA